MVATVFNIFLILVGVTFFVIFTVRAKKYGKGVAQGIRFVGLIPVLLGVVSLLLSTFYTQDIGEVIIVKNWDGALVGTTDNTGLHTKAPWQDTITYTTRNMLINFYQSEGYSYDGGSARGPQVTVNDKSGASANIDIQVIYSLDPSAAMDLYANYGTQTNYTASYLSNDVRSVSRQVSGRFDTITLLTDRSQYQQAVQDALATKWEPKGLHVEQVSVQEVRYPEEITNKYAEAQSAEIAKAQALNEQEAAKVRAETKKLEAQIDAETQIIKAQAEADANRIINESLTENVLRQQYIDALTEIGKNGNLVVVPEGSTPLVNTPQVSE